MKDKSKTILHHYRKTLVHILFCAVLSSGFYACKTDFDVNEKWKEIDIVYGLLTCKDSFILGKDYRYEGAQYVRVSKAFLNNNASALDIAKNPDSLYHKDGINVFLDMYENGNLKNSYTLEKDNSIAKDSGLFAYPSQVLYKTPNGFKLIFDRTDTIVEYKIRVNNPKSGVNVSAKTKVVGPAGVSQFYYHQATHYWRPDDLPEPVRWISARNASFYDVSYIFYITEYDKQTRQITKKEYPLKWPIATTQLTTSLDGNEKNSFYILGVEFYKFIKSSIPENPNVVRRFTKNVDLIIEGGGEDIYYYIQVNQPSIGIVQKKPEYTNIVGEKDGKSYPAYGIFSARSSTLISLPINKETIDSLGTTKLTAKLNFVR